MEAFKKLRSSILTGNALNSESNEALPSYSSLPKQHRPSGLIPTAPKFHSAAASSSGEAAAHHRQRTAGASRSRAGVAVEKVVSEKDAQKSNEEDAKRRALAQKAAREAQRLYDEEHSHKSVDVSQHPTQTQLQKDLHIAIEACKSKEWCTLPMQQNLAEFEHLINEIHVILHLRRTLLLNKVLADLGRNLHHLEEHLRATFKAHHVVGCHVITTGPILKNLILETTHTVLDTYFLTQYLFHQSHTLARHSDISQRPHGSLEDQRIASRLLADGTQDRLRSALDLLHDIGYHQVNMYFGLMRDFGNSMCAPGSVMYSILCWTCWAPADRTILTPAQLMKRTAWDFRFSDMCAETIKNDDMAQILVKAWIPFDHGTWTRHVEWLLTSCYDLSFVIASDCYDIHMISAKIAAITDYIIGYNELHCDEEMHDTSDGFGEALLSNQGGLARYYRLFPFSVLASKQQSSRAKSHATLRRDCAHGSRAVMSSPQAHCHAHHAFDLWHS